MIRSTTSSRGDKAYAILSMCRGLRTVRTGDHVSKREAARGASEELPEHADLIWYALEWRARSHGGRWIDGAATRAKTARFVETALELVGEAGTSLIREILPGLALRSCW